MEKVDESIDKLKEEFKDLKAIEGSLVLPAIEGPEKYTLISDPNKDFNPEELDYLKKENFVIPSEIFDKSLKDEYVFDDTIDKINKHNRDILGKQKKINRNKSLSRKEKKKKNEEIDKKLK